MYYQPTSNVLLLQHKVILSIDLSSICRHKSLNSNSTFRGKTRNAFETCKSVVHVEAVKLYLLHVQRSVDKDPVKYIYEDKLLLFGEKSAKRTNNCDGETSKRVSTRNKTINQSQGCYTKANQALLSPPIDPIDRIIGAQLHNKSCWMQMMHISSKIKLRASPKFSHTEVPLLLRHSGNTQQQCVQCLANNCTAQNLAKYILQQHSQATNMLFFLIKPAIMNSNSFRLVKKITGSSQEVAIILISIIFNLFYKKHFTHL